MITREQIKQVEKLQSLERKLKNLEEDYIDIFYLYHFNRASFNNGTYNYDHEYKKVLKIYIKNAIRKTKKEIKELKG